MFPRWLQFAFILALLWLFLVLAFYYIPHKPFRLTNLLALGRAILALAGGMAVALLGTGLGLFAFRMASVEPPAKLVWSAALGLGVLSLVGLGLGALGLLRPLVLWPLTVIGLLALGPELSQAFHRAKFPKPQGRFETFLAFYLAFSLALALLNALTPPTAWDSLVYHLTGPKFYLRSGKVYYPLDLPYLGFPQLVEMLFTWGMALAGERAATVVHWFYGLLAASIGLGFSESPYLVGALIFSAPTVFVLAGWPYVDIALLVYVTLAFQALEFYRETGSLKWLILSGVMAGFALSVKYTAVIVPIAGFFVILIGSRQKKYAALLPLVASIVFAPWLIKNFALTGNPVYPFFLEGVYWDDWRKWWFGRPWTGFARTNPLKLVTAFWDATIWGIEGAKGYSASLGPLFLGLLPFLLAWKFMPKREQLRVRDALIFSSFPYAFWLFGLAWSYMLLQGRLLLPAFGVLALAISAGVKALENIPPRPINFSWVVRVAITLVLVLNLIEFSVDFLALSPLKVIAGLESEGEFLARRLGWYIKAVEFINQELPEDAVVLFLWEPRSYHCLKACLPDSLLDHFLHSLHLYGYDAKALISAWRRGGATHLLLYRTGLDYLVEEGFDPIGLKELETLREVLALCHKVKDFGKAYQLYELPAQP